MTQIIRNRHVEDDRWETLPSEATTIPQGPVIAPLALWKSHRDELLARRQPVGVWLAPDDEPAVIVPDLEHLNLVAVHHMFQVIEDRQHTARIELGRVGR